MIVVIVLRGCEGMYKMKQGVLFRQEYGREVMQWEAAVSGSKISLVLNNKLNNNGTISPRQRRSSKQGLAGSFRAAWNGR